MPENVSLQFELHSYTVVDQEANLCDRNLMISSDIQTAINY